MYKQLLKTFLGLAICSLSAMEEQSRDNKDILFSTSLSSGSKYMDKIIMEIITLKIQQIQEIQKIVLLHKTQIKLLEERITHQYNNNLEKKSD